MTQKTGEGRTRLSQDSVDKILRYVIVGLVAAVLGLGALFGYSIWQTRQEEATATPAQRALVELEKFVRGEPNSAAGRVRYGEALATAGKLKEATVQLKAAVKLDEKHTGAWLDLGLIAMQSDERAQAQKYFEKVIELTEGAQYEAINQRRETAFFHLGEIALDAKRYEEAAGYFKGSLRIKKDSSSTYYLLANALHGLGDDDAALEQLDAALAFDPNYPEAHYLYGLIHMERKDPVNAAVHLRKALELVPDSTLAKEALARLGTADEAVARSREALTAGRDTEAIDEALLARQLDPKSVEAVLAHARALISTGAKAEAKSTVQDALKLDPDSAEAKRLAQSAEAKRLAQSLK
jgi:tetratricopeptide (TPR) repeat protein